MLSPQGKAGIQLLLGTGSGYVWTPPSAGRHTYRVNQNFHEAEGAQIQLIGKF
jgi:hypothetical protein